MFAVYNTKIGKIKITYEDNIITGINLADHERDNGTKNDLTDNVCLQLQEYLEGKRKKFDIPIKLYGTEFQKKVWNELLKIPYGKTASYEEIAKRIGKPKACRAVGMANHNNPLLIVVPCHRVINRNKKLGGYALGLDIKRMLLEMERKYASN